MDINSLDKKLQGFQLVAQEKLQAIICSIPGKKNLIIETILIKPLEHICTASWLRLKGIRRIFKFDPMNIIPRGVDQVHVFMIQSDMDTFQRVVRHIHELERDEPSDINAAVRNFHMICVPSCFTCFRHILEEEGLYGLVQLHRFNWDFIYIDQGVICQEVLNVFSTVFLKQDPSLLPAIGQSLRILQMVCGRPELILSFGEHASNIVKIMNTLGPWSSKSEDPTDSEFSAMIIVDRSKDYASSLLTPAIYAGLLLEVFNSRAGEVRIEADSNKIIRQRFKLFLVPKHQEETEQSHGNDKSVQTRAKPLTIRLNSLCDEIYGENRYKPFAQASSLVRGQAKKIGLEVQKLSDMKLEQMHDYVARTLPKVKELKMKLMRHLNASEKLIEMLGANFRKIQSLEGDILNNVSRKNILTEIDEMLSTDGQKYNTLRLMCLLHLCSGIAPDEFAQFIRNYCNLFGVRYLSVFHCLSKAGLLPAIPEYEEKPPITASKLLSNLPIPKYTQTEFQANANRLKLIVGSSSGDNTHSNNGQSPSYVFNGMYIPLVAKLCSFLLKVGSGEEIGSKLGMIDKIKLHLLNTSSTMDSAANGMSCKAFAAQVKQGELKDPFPLVKRSILVYVVGGVTYAEIGACNLVARLTNSEITVSSDSIIAGSDLIADAF